MTLALIRHPVIKKNFYNLDELVFDKIIGCLGDRAICNLRGVNSRCNDFITNLLVHNANALSIVFRLYHPMREFPQDALVNRILYQLFKEKLTTPENPITKAAIADLIDENMEIGVISYSELINLLKGMKEEDTPGKYEVCSRIINQLINLYEEYEIDPFFLPTLITDVLELGFIIPTNQITEVKALRFSLFNALNVLVTAAFEDDEEEDEGEVNPAAQVIIERMEGILEMIGRCACFTDEDKLTKDAIFKYLELLTNLIEAGATAEVEEISEGIHGKFDKILPIIQHIFTHQDEQSFQSICIATLFLIELDEAKYIDKEYFNDICNLLKFLPQGINPTIIGARKTLINVVWNICCHSVESSGTLNDVSVENVNDILNFFKQSKDENEARQFSIVMLMEIYKAKDYARMGIEAQFDTFLNAFENIDPNSEESGDFKELFSSMANYNTEIKQKLLDKGYFNLIEEKP